MPSVREIEFEGRGKILYIDYSGCSTAEEMIAVFDEAFQKLSEKNLPSLLLTNFENTALTLPYLNHVKSKINRVSHLIKKNSFVGTDPTKEMIIKTFGLTFSVCIFKSENEAIKFLFS